MCNTMIQTDFGLFDPKFIGATIRIDTPASWEIFKNINNISWNDIKDKPQDEIFQILSVISVIDHEIRHFYDFLLSPYCNKIFKLKANILGNGLQLMLPLSTLNDNSNCIPVPITKWLRLDDTSRNEIIKEWNQWGSIQSAWNPIKIPTISKNIKLSTVFTEDFKKTVKSELPIDLLTAIVEQYELLEELINNTNNFEEKIQIHTFDILELSAILIQIQSIYISFGDEAAQLFMDNLISQWNKPFIKIFIALNNLLSNESFLLQSRMLSAIITWSLLGSIDLDGWDADPVIRLSKLLKHIQKCIDVNISNIDLIELFEEWNDNIGATSLRHTMSDLINKNELYVSKLEEKCKKADIIYSKEILEYIRNYKDASNHIINLFLAAPDKYVYPDLHLDNIVNFVNTPIKIILTSFELVINKEQIPNNWDIIKYREIDEDKLGIKSYVIELKIWKHKIINPEISLKISDYILLLDSLFITYNRDDMDLEILRDMDLLKKQLIEIF
jgi:hypothetical protein